MSATEIAVSSNQHWVKFIVQFLSLSKEVSLTLQRKLYQYVQVCCATAYYALRVGAILKSLMKLCPIEIAYYNKSHVTVLTRATHWKTH